MDPGALTDAERELLDAGRFDDIALERALIHLGLIEGPVPDRPSAAQLDRVVQVFQRLSDAGLIRVGHLEYVDRGPAGRVAPLELVPVPLADLRVEVDEAAASASDRWDWAFACWSVNTDAGDALAAAEGPGE